MFLLKALTTILVEVKKVKDIRHKDTQYLKKKLNQYLLPNFKIALISTVYSKIIYKLEVLNTFSYLHILYLDYRFYLLVKFCRTIINVNMPSC